MKWFAKVFLFWLNVRVKYDAIKNDPNPELQKTSISLGLQSLIMSITGIVATLLAAFGAYWCFARLANSGLVGIFILIGGVICALFAVACYVNIVLASVVYASYQVRLNKRPLGIVALVLSVLFSIAVIVAVLILVLFLGA